MCLSRNIIGLNETHGGMCLSPDAGHICCQVPGLPRHWHLPPAALPTDLCPYAHISAPFPLGSETFARPSQLLLLGCPWQSALLCVSIFCLWPECSTVPQQSVFPPKHVPLSSSFASCAFFVWRSAHSLESCSPVGPMDSQVVSAFLRDLKAIFPETPPWLSTGSEL